MVIVITHDAGLAAAAGAVVTLGEYRRSAALTRSAIK
jgi:hypothetical protein